MTKTQKKNKNTMSNEAFAELEASLKEALAYEKGKIGNLRVTKRLIPPTPQQMSNTAIASLRSKLQCSQSIFAKLLNVSVKTIQAWEQGTRKPSDVALKLLTIADKHPEVLFEI